MDNNLDNFLNNPFACKYLEYCESVLCETVSTLSAICDEVTKKKFKPKASELSEIIGYINKQCSGLMRALEFSATLRSLAENSDYTIVNIKRFLNVFVDKCNCIVENLCSLEFLTDEEIEIKIQKNVTSYAILEFIRSYALEYGKDTHFNILCRSEENNIIIEVSVKKSEKENKFPRKSTIKFFEEYFDDINEVLSEKSGTQYKFYKDLMRLVIPKYIKSTTFSNEPIFDTDEKFLKYYTMLADINNEIDFY